MKDHSLKKQQHFIQYNNTCKINKSVIFQSILGLYWHNGIQLIMWINTDNIF